MNGFDARTTLELKYFAAVMDDDGGEEGGSADRERESSSRREKVLERSVENVDGANQAQTKREQPAPHAPNAVAPQKARETAAFL